jgi:branched-chain amino acid transport system permease protein
VLALDQMIYGLLLILFIIYMPKGILGTLLERREKKRGTPSAGAQAAARSRVESGAST